MNSLRAVWRDINTMPFPVETEPRTSISGVGMISDIPAKSLVLGSSKPHRITKPKQKPLNRNDKIRLSLQRAYPTSHRAILDQAYGAYYSTNPASQNLPELYELLESGFLDQGIEACGLGQWAIGRPK